jgi:DNA-binding NarL/FixJ family response regulator
VGVGTLGLLAAAADEGPVLALVEDLPWLDSASTEALAFATRRLRAEAMAVLVSCRTSSTMPFDPHNFEELTLEGLDAQAADCLLAERAGGPVASTALEQLVSATGGNPLALIELVRVLTASQLSGRAPLPDPLPARALAERLFADQIAMLDEEAQRTLVLAAAAGDGTVGPVLAAAAAAGLTAAAFERVEAVGLFSLVDGRLVFCHPLARSAAYAAAQPGERRAAHRALAPRSSNDRRAWHLAAAAFGEDEEAAAALEQAAERAKRRSGFAAAALALERAARLSPDEADRARRLLAAADAAHLAGQRERALNNLDEANEHLADDPEIHAASLRLRARIEHAAGRARDAWRHFHRAAELLEDTDPQQAANALAGAALAALIAGDYDDAVRMAAKAYASHGEDNADVAPPTSRLILGYALWRSGSTAEGFAMLVTAAERAEQAAPDEPEDAIVAAFMLVLVVEYRLAASILERIIREARTTGALGVLPFALSISAYLDIRRGRWASGYASANESAELASETGGGLWRCIALSALATVEAGQGRAQACREHAREAHTLAAQLDIELNRDVFDALGLLELGLGNLEPAIEAFQSASGVPGQPHSLQLRPSTPELVEALARTSSPRAGELARIATAHAEATQLPAFSALAARCRGLVAADDDFDRHFDDALRLLAPLEWPFVIARTALNYGERLRRAGRRREARAQLHTALEVFHRLDCAPWADRAEHELRATGERIRRRDPTATERLTAQELQIALAIAGGATNREAGQILFLSHKTIEHHLSVIYRKLGLRSRTDLTRAIATQSIPELTNLG